MKTKFTKSFLLSVVVILSSCNKDEGNDDIPSMDDSELSIISILTTSKSAYEAADQERWVSITASEYEELAEKLEDVAKSGVSDAQYSNINLTFSPLGFTFVNDIGATIPANHYLFAFKYSSNSDVLEAQARVKISETNVNSGYSMFAFGLPAHPSGENFFVFKGTRPATQNESHLAIYSAKEIGYITGESNGKYFFNPGNASEIDQAGDASLGLVLTYQGLSSSVQY
ncbi:hypothetical protein [Ekhidna sp.]